VGVSGSNLSGGQKQMVNFTRSLLKDAPILILDEPTSALDANTKKMVLELIKKLRNKTVIIITHDKAIVPCVDKVYELSGGRLKMI
jgi:ABC-type bacteriocin/lantibiotic exporter with double-glycine peptidase domain